MRHGTLQSRSLAFPRLKSVFACATLALCVGNAVAQAPNRVPDLDGEGDHVVLPPNIFTNLTEATVEVWARWQTFRAYSRIFESGAAYHSMSMFNHLNSPDLRFNLYPEFTQGRFALQHQIRVNGLLGTNQWIHLAAVSGPGGMKLYVNGTLAGEHPIEASFASIKVYQTNQLGRGLVLAPNDQDFQGQMDEFRVWNHRRTEDQIRADMSKRLTGTEPGLVGLWNFDGAEDGSVRDSSPGRHHGKLMGDARSVAAQLPDAPPGGPTSVQPSVIFGKLTDNEGKPIADGNVRVFAGDRLLAAGQARLDGGYSIAFRGPESRLDIEAIGGSRGNWAQGVVYRSTQRNEVNLVLSESVSISGNVTALDGSLIPGVVVQVVRADAPARQPGDLIHPGWVATTVTTSTNTTENFRFINLRIGEYKVLVHLPDRVVAFREGEAVRVESGKRVRTDFQIAPFHKGQWRRYSTANGLANNRVSDLHFSPDGILWLATTIATWATRSEQSIT